MSSYESSDPAEELRRSVRATFQAEIPQKSLLIAYVFWFFFGGFGGHRFYLGRPVSAAILIVLNLFNLGMAIKNLMSIAHSSTSNEPMAPQAAVVAILQGGLGMILGAAVLLWLLIDLFLIPGMRRAYERKYQEDLA